MLLRLDARRPSEDTVYRQMEVWSTEDVVSLYALAVT